MNVHRMRFPAAALLLLAVAACGAQPRKQVQLCPTTYPTAVNDTMVMRATPARGSMGRHLQVWLRLPAQRPDLKDLRLFIDGHPVPGLDAAQIGARCALRDSTGALMGFLEVHEFVPARTEESKAAWAHLLGSPTAFVDTVRVGAGLANGPEFKVQPIADSTRVVFTVVDKWTFWWVTAVFVVLLGILLVAGARTTLLRDSPAVEPPPNPPAPVPPVPNPPAPNPPVRGALEPDTPKRWMPPFSLAKVMMAMWTFIILGGFFGIWLIIGDHRGILTAQSLLLLGIVGASTAASVAMTRNKNEPVARRDRELRRQEALLRTTPAADRAQRTAALEGVEATREVLRREHAPGSRDFFTDLLSDANGPVLHRFQNLLWHVALAIVFIVGTYRALAFPEFDDTLLLLLGISEGVYLGLKLPEPPKPPDREPPAEEPNPA